LETRHPRAFLLGGYMELSDQIKQIAEFWLGFEFLKKFKETGTKYAKEINKEKTNGFEQVKRTIS
jgi:hypothetical protein